MTKAEYAYLMLCGGLLGCIVFVLLAWVVAGVAAFYRFLRRIRRR